MEFLECADITLPLNARWRRYEDVWHVDSLVCTVNDSFTEVTQTSSSVTSNDGESV